MFERTEESNYRVEQQPGEGLQENPTDHPIPIEQLGLTALDPLTAPGASGFSTIDDPSGRRSPDGAQGNVSYRALLRNHSFRLLWVGQIVSVFGDRLHQIALLVLVGSLTANNLSAVGLLFATIGIPSLLFGLGAGALVDRWPRQPIMIISDLVRALLVAALPWAARIDIMWVYVITFLLTTVSLFFRPAIDATIPDIVPRQGLLSANSLSSATDTVIDVLGYPLAGALVGGLSGALSRMHGIDLAFYIDAGTYLFSAGMIARMTIPRSPVGQEHTGFRGIVRMVVEGLRFVRSHPILLTNISIIALGALVSAGEYTLTFGYAADVTGTGAFGYSILEAAVGLGNVIGGLAIGRWGARYAKGPLILIGLVIYGATHVTLSLISSLWIAAVILVVGGMGNMAFFILSITLVQEATPAPFRGRVLSFRSSLIMAAFVSSNLLLGAGAQRYGVQVMWAVNGTLLMLVGLLGFLAPSARNAR